MATNVEIINELEMQVLNDPRYEDLRPIFEYIFEILRQIQVDLDANL